MRRLALVIVASAVGVTYLVASAMPAAGADSGTVSAQVTVAAPCITVDPEAIDFGTLPFSHDGEFGHEGTQAVGYASCSASEETVFARGTDATGSSALWALRGDLPQPCVAGPNAYLLDLYAAGQFFKRLSTSDQEVETLSASTAGSGNLLALNMPCAGSDGAGQTMSFQVVFTATL